MLCPKCSSENNEDAKFCTNCGVSLIQVNRKAEITQKFCRYCGEKLSEGADYCASCGKHVKAPFIAAPITRLEPKLEIAGWGERFVAWLIDFIIIGVVLGIIKLFIWASWPSFVWVPGFPRGVPFVDIGLDSIIYFLYWTFLESGSGQSIGKTVMRIRVIQLDERPMDLFHAAIESVGKAFLLPIDCVIGLILYSKNNQRLFNFLSETVVVKVS